MVKNNSLAEFCKALKKFDHFLLSCHVVPEGDAIGSLLAVDSLLRRLGKKTTVVCQDEFPTRLSCLSAKRWHQVQDIKVKPEKFQALVVTDCPTLERVGTVKNLISPKTVIFNIDHHISNVYFGHYNFVLPQAAASGEVVMALFRHLKMKLTKEEATNLYVALSTDTGSFKHGNTSVESHKMAAELIAAGIDVEKINEEIYANYSINKIHLYSRLLGRIKTTANGKVAWVYMKREDLHNSAATDEDTEGFIDFLKYIKEVQIAFFITELPKPGELKVSFRAKGTYDVNRIATQFGGGGHRKASGCTLRVSVEEAEKMVLHALQKAYSLS